MNSVRAHGRQETKLRRGIPVQGHMRAKLSYEGVNGALLVHLLSV